MPDGACASATELVAASDSYYSFHRAYDLLPLPAIVNESRRFIRRRGKAVVIETGNHIPINRIMRRQDPKPAFMLGASGLRRGAWTSRKARHESDQIAAIVQPLIIDCPIAGGIGRALD